MDPSGVSFMMVRISVAIAEISGTDWSKGTIDTLKHLKKDVSEIRKGMECGISFHGFNDIRVDDEVVTYTTFETARDL